MGGAPWVVQEGYLRVKKSGAMSPTAALRGKWVERYFVLYLSRKLDVFENSNKTARLGGGAIHGFGGWSGDGLLKAGEAYGLELQVDKSEQTQWFVAAYNRVDLEKWCRGFVAVLDPESAPGREARRARRKARKEEKKALEEKKARYLQWKEQQRQLVEGEQQRVAAREDEIQHMTPLERMDGLGSLDDDTARMLEKRKQRLQRRAAPTAGRVNKIAFRRRMEEAAGGKLENMAPLPAKVVEQRVKVRIEAPPPGQFFEATHNTRRRSSTSRARREEEEESDSELGSLSSEESRSGSRVSSSRSGPSSRDLRSASSGDTSPSVPPPPPPLPLHPARDDASDSYEPPPFTPTSTSRDGSFRGRRPSGVDGNPASVQHTLAAILNGRSIPASGYSDRLLSRRSESSASLSNSMPDDGMDRRSIPNVTSFSATDDRTVQPSMATAFAASLAAVRREREDSVERASEGSREGRDYRQRLSTEGRNMFKAAVQIDQPRKSTSRKGLFDSSDEDDDSDSDGGLFGLSKIDTKHAKQPTSNGSVEVNPIVSQSHPDNWRPADDGTSTTSSHSSPQALKTVVQPTSVPVTPTVLFKSHAVKNDGKKSVAVFSFSIQAGGTEYSFSHSYHEFEEIHERLSTHFATDVLPKFPPKHWYRNNTKPENVQKRAEEFLQYLQGLVAIPCIFSNEQFRLEFSIPKASDQTQNNVVQPSNGYKPEPRSRPPTPPVQQDRQQKNKGQRLFEVDDSDSDSDTLLTSPKRRDQPRQPIVEASSERVRAVEKTKRREKHRSGSSSRRRGGSSAHVPSPVVNSPQPQPPVPVKAGIAGLPPRPNPFGGGRGDLMAAIRQGAQLKSVAAEASASPASALHGVTMNRPTTPQVPLGAIPQQPSIAEAISNAMATRRVHIEYEEASDGEDSDDDWDD